MDKSLVQKMNGKKNQQPLKESRIFGTKATIKAGIDIITTAGTTS